jgi:trigger factor
MELVQTNIDALNATIKITLTEADYKPQVEKALKLAATKVTMPGFRAGMVPMGMVKKTYGKSILLEELNKAINKA